MLDKCGIYTIKICTKINKKQLCYRFKTLFRVQQRLAVSTHNSASTLDMSSTWLLVVTVFCPVTRWLLRWHLTNDVSPQMRPNTRRYKRRDNDTIVSVSCGHHDFMPTHVVCASQRWRKSSNIQAVGNRRRFKHISGMSKVFTLLHTNWWFGNELSFQYFPNIAFIEHMGENPNL